MPTTEENCYKLDCWGNFETLLVPGLARLVTEEFDRGDLSREQVFCTGEYLAATKMDRQHQEGYGTA